MRVKRDELIGTFRAHWSMTQQRSSSFSCSPTLLLAHTIGRAVNADVCVYLCMCVGLLQVAFSVIQSIS